MPTVVEAFASQPPRPVFIGDFSPPRGSDPELLAGAQHLDADFVCAAYNPGKLVRVDSASAALFIQQHSGRDAIFNLSPRDMNRLALESRLLGADLLGLRNLVVVQGDGFTEREPIPAVNDYTSTRLIKAVADLNQGLDWRGARLRSPTHFCIGASLDLTRELDAEVELTRHKLEAGAQFFISQPVFSGASVRNFLEAYARRTGAELQTPVFWGVQILAADGVLFSSVPQQTLDQLQQGRDAIEIALESYQELREAGLRGVYLVSPVLRGGARDYEAGGRFLAAARALN